MSENNNIMVVMYVHKAKVLENVLEWLCWADLTSHHGCLVPSKKKQLLNFVIT